MQPALKTRWKQDGFERTGTDIGGIKKHAVLASCVLNPLCPYPSLGGSQPWVFHGVFPLFHSGHSTALTREKISITASAGGLSALKHTSSGSGFLHNLFLPPTLYPLFNQSLVVNYPFLIFLTSSVVHSFRLYIYLLLKPSIIPFKTYYNIIFIQFNHMIQSVGLWGFSLKSSWKGYLYGVGVLWTEIWHPKWMVEYWKTKVTSA